MGASDPESLGQVPPTQSANAPPHGDAIALPLVHWEK